MLFKVSTTAITWQDDEHEYKFTVGRASKDAHLVRNVNRSAAFAIYEEATGKRWTGKARKLTGENRHEFVAEQRMYAELNACDVLAALKSIERRPLDSDESTQWEWVEIPLEWEDPQVFMTDATDELIELLGNAAFEANKSVWYPDPSEPAKKKEPDNVEASSTASTS